MSSRLIVDSVLCEVVYVAGGAGAAAILYGKVLEFLAKADAAEKTKEFFRVCAQSQSCDPDAAAKAANKSFADTAVKGLETGVSATPILGVPTSAGEMLTEVATEAAKEKMIEEAKKKAEESRKQRDPINQAIQKAAAVEEQRRAEEMRKREEKERKRKCQNDKAKTCAPDRR